MRSAGARRAAASARAAAKPDRTVAARLPVM
jgi:hypothetical protein